MKGIKKTPNNKRKRIISFMLSALMVLSIVMPSGSSEVRYNAYAEGEEDAAYESVELTTEEITEEITEVQDESAQTQEATEQTSEEENDETAPDTESTTEAANDTYNDDTDIISDIDLDNVTASDKKNDDNEDDISSSNLDLVRDGEYDLGTYITQITISTQSGSNWIPIADGTTINDGTSVQIKINYTTSEGIITSDNKQMTYTLPTTVKLDANQQGTVESSNQSVGTYIIDTEGNVTITYYDEFASDGKAFSGTLTFQCTANNDSSEDKSHFGFTGEVANKVADVSIAPKDTAFDVSAEKSGVVNNGDGTVTYTVTISSEKGTKGDVTLHDSFSGNNVVALDLSSVKLDGADFSVDTDYNYGFNATIPQMSANSSHILTYTANIDSNAVDKLNSDKNIKNTITATSVNNTSNDDTDFDINHTIVSKSVSGNTWDSEYFTYTIKVNSAKIDLNGKVLQDVFTYGEDKVELSEIQEYSVVDDSGTDLTSTITKEQLFGSGYTFGSNSNHEYTITYKIPIPDNTTLEKKYVNNTVTVDKDNPDHVAWNDTTSKGIDPISYDVGKNDAKLTADDNLSWVLRIKIPDETDKLNNFVITDTLGDNQIITKEQAEAFTFKINGSTVDPSYYTIVFGDNLTADNVPTEGVTSFKITFNNTDTNADVFVKDRYLEIGYESTPDFDAALANLDADRKYTFTNTAHFKNNDYEVDKTAKYDFIDRDIVNKFIKAKDANNSVWWTDSPQTMDYDDLVVSSVEGKGNVQYILRVNCSELTGNKTHTLVDTLPDGASIVGSAIVYTDWNDSDTYVNPSNEVLNDIGLVISEEGKKLTVSIPSTYEGSDWKTRKLNILYTVHFEKSTTQGEKTYSNTVVADDEEQTTLDFTINTENTYEPGNDEVLSKFGKQGIKTVDDGHGGTEESSTNEVEYWVFINQNAEDLDLNSDYLELEDTLTVNNTMINYVELVAGSVHLYNYDADSTDEQHKGTEIASGYNVGVNGDYTDTGYTGILNVTVPDEKALVLVYKYKIDFQNLAAATQIFNDVNLVGVKKVENNVVEYAVASSSATAGKQTSVTMYKVDSQNINLYLEGAKIKIEYFNDDGVSSGSWVTEKDSMEIPTDGITFTTGTETGNNIVNVQYDKIYKITEVEAPVGYVKRAPKYMMFVNPDSDESRAALVAKKESIKNYTGFDLANNQGVDTDIEYCMGMGGTTLLKNELSDDELTIQKIWEDNDGSALSTPPMNSVTFDVYEQSMKIEKYNVAVKTERYDQYGSQYYSLTDYDTNFEVDKNSNQVTIRWHFPHALNPDYVPEGYETFKVNNYYNSEDHITTFTLNDAGYSEYLGDGYGADLVYTTTITDDSVITMYLPYNQLNQLSYVNPVYTAPIEQPTDRHKIATVTVSGDTWKSDVIKISECDNHNSEADVNYYYIEETTVPSGFAVSYNDGLTHGNLIATNTKTTTTTTGSITLKKTFVDSDITKDDIEEGQITFTIEGPNEYSETVDYISFSNGMKTISNLEPGNYTVTEHSTLDGIGKKYDRTTTVKVGNGDTEEDDVANVSVSEGSSIQVVYNNNYTRKTGNLVIRKLFDSSVAAEDYPSDYKNVTFKANVTLYDESGTKLSGTKIYDAVINGSDTTITFNNGEAIDIVITGNNSATIKDIPYGYQYEVTEQTPTTDGYSIKEGNGTATGTIDADSQDATVTNTYEAPSPSTIPADISLTKVDSADSDTKIEGAVFYIYSDAGCTTKIGEMTTDENGVATYHFDDITDALNSGTSVTYYIKEHSVPAAYIPDTDTKYTVVITVSGGAVSTITYNGESSLTVENDKATATLNIKKVDSADDTIGLVGAGFTLYSDAECSTVEKEEQLTTAVNDYTVTFTGLEPGRDYWYKETTVPDNYNADNTGAKKISIPAADNADVTVNETVTNTYKTGDVTIRKDVTFENNDLAANYNTQDFTVEVVLANTNANVTLDGSYDTEVTTGGVTSDGTIDFSSKKASITLKDNDVIRIKNLPVGTTVTVTETGSYETVFTGYTYDDTDSTDTDNGTISDTTEELALVNNYSRTKGQFTVTKRLTGDGADGNMTFPINVALTFPTGVTTPTGSYYVGDYNATTNPGTPITGTDITVDLAKDEVVTFTGIPYGTRYDVSEDLSAATYDNYTNESITSGGSDGHIGEVGASSPAIVVNNKFTQTAKLTINKKVTGRDWDVVKGDIKFTVTDNGSPANTWTITGNQLNDVGDGTYAYTIPDDLDISKTYSVTETYEGTATEDGYFDWDYTCGMSANPDTKDTTAVESITFDSTNHDKIAYFVNDYERKEGSFKVTKKLTDDSGKNETGNHYDKENTSFKINVKFTFPTGSELTKVKVNDNDVELENSIATITLKEDEEAVFTKIPYGTTYEVSETISETDLNNGYLKDESNNIVYGDGTLTQGFVDSASSNVDVTVNNKYNWPVSGGFIKISKFVDGDRNWDEVKSIVNFDVYKYDTNNSEYVKITATSINGADAGWTPEGDTYTYTYPVDDNTATYKVVETIGSDTAASYFTPVYSTGTTNTYGTSGQELENITFAGASVQTNAYFKNDYTVNKGSFTVTKNVQNAPDGDTTSFPITVTLTYHNKLVIGGNYRIETGTLNTINSSNTNVTINEEAKTAVVSISLKDGEAATFTNIPYGTTYQVTEDIPATADYAKYSLDTTTPYGYSDSAKIIADATVDTVDVNNVYTPDGKIVIYKTISGADWDSVKGNIRFIISDDDPATDDITINGSQLTESSGKYVYTYTPCPLDKTYTVIEEDTNSTAATSYYQVTAHGTTAGTAEGSLTETDTVNVGEVNAANPSRSAYFNNAYERKTTELIFNKSFDPIPATLANYDDEPFDVKIILKKEDNSPVTGTYNTTVGGTPRQITFNADGEATIQISVNDSVTITGLPRGYKYSFTEQPKTGFSNVDNTGVKALSTMDNPSYTHNIVNAYTPVVVEDAELDITKAVTGIATGDTSANNHEFRLTIEYKETPTSPTQYVAKDTNEPSGYAIVNTEPIGTAIPTIKAGETLVIKNLEYGTYTVTEYDSDLRIANYIFQTAGNANPSVTTGEVEFTSNTTKTINLINNYVENREINIAKYDEDGTTPLSDAKLSILRGTNVIVPEWTTDGRGKDITDARLKSGVEYTLRETTAPDGYVVVKDVKFKIGTDNKITFTSNPDNAATATGNNISLKNKKTRVKISKVDATSKEELPGAKIRILDENDNPVTDELSGEPIEWISTNTPHEVIGLKTGKTYKLEEVTAPDGYQITEITTFKLKPDGTVDKSNSTTTVSNANVLLVQDYPLGKLVINKRGLYNELCAEDSDATKPLEGVKFTITKADNTTVAKSATTDANGVATFTDLAPGNYEVKETQTVGDYLLDEQTYTVKINADGTNSGLKDASGKAVPDNTIINDEFRADIRFVKVKLGDTSQKLPGSTYGLYKKNASNALTQIAQATTDDEGVLEFEGVFIGVEYTVQEITAPEGFYVSENPITISFAVNEDGEPVIDKIDDGSGTIIRNANGEITWLEPEISVSFLKQDLVGNNLEGAKLKVVDSDGNEVISWTSTKEAYLVDGVFSAGETYSLVEVEAPEGYDIATPVSFTIDEKAGSEGKDTITVIMQDAPKSRTEVKAPVKSNPEAPKTRDNAPIRPVTTMMMSSLAGIMYLILIGKRQRRRRIKR